MKFRFLLSFSAMIPAMAFAEVPANYPGLPFTEDGSAWSVPADGTAVTIKAGDFDYVPGTESGKTNEVIGQNMTYRHKNEGQKNNYRPVLPLGIGGNGEKTDNNANGDWVCYTVDFPSDGLYKMAFTCASGANNSNVYFSLDGAYNEDGTYVVVDTADENKCHRENPDRICYDIHVDNMGWDVYQETQYSTYTVPVTKGTHVLRLHFRGDGTNTQNILVSRVGDMPKGNFPFADLEVKDGAEIYMRDFDRGGEGVAYHNAENAAYKGDGTYNRFFWEGATVEINGKGGIGNTANGEWMAYTVNVTEPGNYTIVLTSAGPGDSRYHYLIDRAVVSADGVAHKSASGWDDYSATSEVSDIQLGEGTHEIRFYTTGGINVMKMTFKKAGEYEDPSYKGTPYTDHSIPGIIEAENFDLGGQGVAFNNPRHDGDQIFNGTGYREDAVDAVDMERKTINGDERLYLHYMNGSKWFRYTFTNDDDEYPYEMYACISTHNQDNHTEKVTVSFLHDATKEYVSNVFVGKGWDNFEEVAFPDKVTLPAGQVTMHVSTPANFDYVKFVSTNPEITTGIDGIAAEGKAVVITGDGTIRVEGCEGIVNVIALNGITVAQATASQTIDVASGLYIVRAGAQVFKVLVK